MSRYSNYDQPYNISRSSSAPASRYANYDDRRSTSNNGYESAAAAPPAPNRWAAAAAQAAEGQTNNGGYRSWETVDEEPEQYDDSGWLDRKTQKVQNDSLMSSRRALQRLNRADEVAVNNLSRLHSQGEQLGKVSARLDSAQQHAKVADAKTDHLKSLNKLFFLPSFGGKKAKRREERVLAATNAQEAAASATSETAPNDEYASGSSLYGDRSYGRTAAPTRSYSTPENINRDATEEEIDDNIDQISSGLTRLKMMSQSMNAALDKQTGQIRTISSRTDTTKEYIRSTSRKIDNIK
ncbi:Protein transport protein S9 plasma membrane t-SNARE [Geranomyces variabilis]|uniref:Protein transport protein S9 plasma membrane t-SNARE n=1 Tax=Geranomyces variabilis TaxID=109894 RepID=A0AAD5XRC2_9FUNG|nr:Protein transport protein S9 plasma membrane t-SNARE [Geranomyces variabilis]